MGAPTAMVGVSPICGLANVGKMADFTARITSLATSRAARMWQGISTVIAEATFCLQTALSVWLWSLPAAIIMAVITLSLVWAVSTRTFQREIW